MGRVVGIDANVLTFNSDDPSSNLANVYNFSELIAVEKTKMNEKRPGLAHLKTLFLPTKIKISHGIGQTRCGRRRRRRRLLNSVSILHCCCC